MYEYERVQIDRSVDKWVRQGKLNKKSDIYIFGVNDYAREIVRKLRDNGLEALEILDNDRKKHGQHCCGILVSSQADHSDSSSSKYIICSFFWREMRTALQSKGIDMKRILIVHIDTFMETSSQCFFMILQGRKIYSRIIKKYPGHKLFLCPYTGTGDAYLIGTFWKQYMIKENIGDFAMIVVNGACEKVLKIFGFENIIRLNSTDECYHLTKYYLLCPDECKLVVLNDSWPSICTNNIQWLRGLHGMDFTEMFRRFVFELPKDVMPIQPVISKDNAEVKKIFEENSLIEGKTIVLSPYATTLSDMPDSFWDDLAALLKEKGYVLCTNCGGKDEKPVKGTKGVFFPLNIAPHFIERAGGFIGIRSGFCDVISGSSAKKVILYDAANYFFNCSAFDYFSLKKMGLSEDAIEIEFNNNDPAAKVKIVADCF